MEMCENAENGTRGTQMAADTTSQLLVQFSPSEAVWPLGLLLTARAPCSVRFPS